MSAQDPGLDGLFESDEELEAPSRSDAAETEVDLAALFEEDGGEASSAPEDAEPAAGSPEDTSDFARQQSPEDPQDEHPSGPMTPDLGQPPRQDAPTVHFKALQIASSPPSPDPREAEEATASRPPDEPRTGEKSSQENLPAPEEEEEKEAAEAAEPRMPQEATAAERSRWRSEMDRLWPSVEHVLRIAGSAVALDPVRKSLQLTQDPLEDDLQRERLMAALRPEVASSSASEAFSSREDIEPVTRFVYDEVLGISVLGDLWRDPEVTEIMVDSWDRIVVEKHGRLFLTERSFRSPEHAASIARSLALRISDRAVSNAIPLVTAELPKARVSIAYGPVVKGGLSITIRKFKTLLGLEGLREFKALDESMVSFLEKAVRARATILVSGGTGAGKTTIINLLSAFIPPDERVITIEDAFELQLANTHVVSLQTKEAASADDTISVSLADLLRSTLRMRPDRIVVGEIREPEAAEVMLAAANTGHAGTMTTIHANTADAALNERLVDLLLQMRPGNEQSVRRTIAEAFDIVVQVSRAKDGSRYVSEIALVTGISNAGAITTVTLFRGSGDRASRNFTRETVPAKAQEILDRLLG